MKRRIAASIVIALATFAFITGAALAAPTSTIVQNLVITGVKSAPCLTTNGSGLVASTTCGSGGGIASTTPFTSGQIVVVSGTAISTNGFTTSDFLASSTTYVANNTGNWAGTWQTYSPSYFYAASNPSGYIATSTGLTTANFASPNISQWTNNSGYITTSTYNGNFGTAASHPATDFLSSSTAYVANNTGNWAGTVQSKTLGTISTFASTDYLTSSTTYLATNTGNWAGTVQGKTLGTISTFASTDYLTSSTVYVATNTGNWAGTWQGVNSSTFYLATNPNHFISSSTGNGLYLQIANNLSDVNNSSTARTNLGIGATSALALAGSTGIQTSYLGSTNPCATNQAPTTLSAVGALGGCTATFLTSAITSFNGSTGPTINYNVISGNTLATTSVASSGGNSTTTLTVNPTLATSSFAFVISNATTTNNTSSYMEWIAPTAGTLTKILCKDSVGTTTITFFEPTSYATTTVSSTISSALSCGTASNSSTLSTAFSINTPFIVEVTSTVGVAVATPVQIIYTKQ